MPPGIGLHWSIMINMLSNLEGLFACVLFSYGGKLRSHWIARVVISLLVTTGFIFLFGWFRSEITNIWSGMAVTLMMNAYQLGLMFFCLKDRPSHILVRFVGALCVHQISEQVFGFLNQFGGSINNVLIGGWTTGNLDFDFVLRLFARFAFMFLIFLPIRNSEVQDDAVMRRRVITITSVCALFIVVVTRVETEYRDQSFILSNLLRITMLLFCLLILFIRSRFFDISRQQRENLVMSNIIENQRVQYDNFRDSVNYINSVCHDLKKRIKALQGKISEEELSDMKNALALYNSRFKTGNEVLDMVLYQCRIVCDKHHIRLTCMADGQAVAFMEKNDLYTLLMNALSNAIEASQKVEDAGKRLISLTVRRQNALLEIQCANYFDGKVERNGEGALETTKADGRLHGLGMRSMRYVAGEYEGVVEEKTDGDIFILSIYIPIQNDKPAA